MNDIKDLNTEQIRELTRIFTPNSQVLDNGMIGKFVIVRCHDAGVHAGFLESYNGRECILTESRRLWYWKPENNASFLSGVATEGLHQDSKIGPPIKIHLTENCEIIECTPICQTSISEFKSYESEDGDDED